ncbi:nitrate/nitrite porter [Mycena maculata]|uniref:Nitrate/nitrite transporter n=1 Tax=Mycena maculata TaxID=230809 RepID=A0AAD7MJJ0_9AGAR|nr:nitrate/nitrite porter [Mycena maculata]
MSNDIRGPAGKAIPSDTAGKQDAPRFKWSHLWEPPIINPVNGKSYTLPILNLGNPYSRSFHLSWLGFFVAFLSWFAFPPLIPDAIKSDLELTQQVISNSNIVALAATLGVRLVVGPLVDRYGPRKVMAGLLILGAIPSGLAGTAHNAQSLYVLRFFIGILGGTFVPCQAWTSCFFDKNIIGTANAFAGGWGNMGGGATFAIMVATYSGLRSDGLSNHSAWRAAFAIVPVPILLSVAVIILVFGQDHPAGKWSQRHTLPATTIAIAHGHHVHIDADEKFRPESADEKGLEASDVHVRPVGIDEEAIESTVDFAVNESLTFQSAATILVNPLTWLPALAYMTTFGLELTLDAQMENTLFGLFSTRIRGFGQDRAGYYTSIFGFLNLVTRPFGGYLGDIVYRRYGTKGKKFLTLFCGLVMGAGFLAGGLYLQNNHAAPHLPTLATVMGVFAVAAIFAEIGNGANFSLVPHCNSYNNGVMSGIVGGFGNLGGIFFAIIFRFQPATGKAFWIIGAVSIAINVLLIPIPVPDF